MTLALAAVAAAPEAGRGGAPIKYTVRFVEADGLGWRDALYTRLTSVTRQGSATVWTAPSDVARRLHTHAMKTASARIMQAPTVIAWPGAPAHVTMQASRQLVTQVAWNGDDRPVEAKPETVRTGSAATMAGREIDQGILVQMVLQDTQIIAVHRVGLGGSKGTHSDPAAKKAAYHADACDGTSKCCDAGEQPKTSRTVVWSMEFNLGGDKGISFLPGRYNKDGLNIIPAGQDCCGSCTPSKDEPTKMPAKITAMARAPKPGDGVVAVSVPASGCCANLAACGSSPGEGTAIAVEVPEIGSQEIAGEWLIPKDGVLLVSFGPHTVADKDGKAVIRERLAIIQAEECEETLVLPGPSASAVWREVPNPGSAHWFGPALLVPALPAPDAGLPAPVPAPPTPGAIPPPALPPAAGVPAAMPPMPSRSFPQGVHADGKTADLPPLPADEADDDGDDEASGSAEARPSPQMKQPRHPDRTEESRSRKRHSTTDAAMKKVQFSLADFPAIPALFQPAPAVGLQFLIPIKPVSFKLPFNRRLEIEIYGRVVRNPEPARSSADLVTKAAKCETTTK
jgi:hypothetical protein